MHNVLRTQSVRHKSISVWSKRIDWNDLNVSPAMAKKFDSRQLKEVSLSEKRWIHWIDFEFHFHFSPHIRINCHQTFWHDSNKKHIRVSLIYSELFCKQLRAYLFISISDIITQYDEFEFIYQHKSIFGVTSSAKHILDGKFQVFSSRRGSAASNQSFNAGGNNIGRRPSLLGDIYK